MKYIIPALLTTYLLLVYSCQPEGPNEADMPVMADGVVNGIDTLTGLVAKGDYLLVKGNCLACHSSRLILQQGATREGWTEMIHWMQDKQGLQDLGKNEGPIVEYLATYYAPEETGRRAPLGEVEWYEFAGDSPQR